MRVRSWFLLALAFAGCTPIRTAHTYDFAFPRKRTDFTVRWIGTASGRPAVWISTADDGEDNGRYEGFQAIVDPGTPADVEATVLPWLFAHGLKKGAPVAYVLSTTADPPRVAGVERLAREFVVKQVIEPIPPGPRGRGLEYGGRMAGYLELGPEISARVLRPEGTEALGVQTYAIRFINAQFLLLPPLPAAVAADYGRALQGILAKEGLHGTVVSSDAAIPSLESELWVGGPVSGDGAGDNTGDNAGVPLAIPAPGAGESLALTTNGSEIHVPGGRTRSRYGHWIDCHHVPAGTDDARCVGHLAAPASGPLLVPFTVAGAEGWFLVDTRAPLSYLARPRFQAIPGWEKAETGVDEHASEAAGLELPPVPLGKDGPVIRRWHVLPCEPFSIAGREIAGVVGMDLLQSFRITIERSSAGRAVTLALNFDEEREDLTKSVVTEAGFDIPLDHSPAGPLLLSTLDGESKSLVLDLAAPQSAIFVRPADLAAKTTGTRERAWTSFTIDTDLQRAEWKKLDVRAGELKVADLNLFGAHFLKPAFLGVDHPLGADVLGMDFLDGFSKAEIDFRRRSLRLAK